MKKIILVILVCLYCLPLRAQEYPSPPVEVNDNSGYSLFSNINVVGYAGSWWLYRNLKNNGSWNGIYIDTRLSEARKPRGIWSLGVYGIASWSRFESNLTRYSSHTEEYGAGIVIGYYTERFSVRRPMFLGTSLGFKYSSDIGESKLKSGTYRGVQNDLILSLGFNFNIVKTPVPGDNMWPRTQVQISLEKPLNTSRTTSWNGQQFESDKWDRAYIDGTIRQSIINYYYSVKLVITPKIIGGYSHSFGDNKDNYSIGAEVALHKPMEDDYLSVYWMFKGNGKFDRNLSVVGLNINFALIF